MNTLLYPAFLVFLIIMAGLSSSNGGYNDYYDRRRFRPNAAHYLSIVILGVAFVLGIFMLGYFLGKGFLFR